MGKRLVIAEKPSVARDIAAALGDFEDHEHYFESQDYVVTWAVGHLLQLSEPQDYDAKWRSWSVKNLPVIPSAFTIKPRDGQKTRLNQIKKLGMRSDIDEVINACDAGREGELIYRRIVEFTGLDGKPSERLWLQSMTADAIREAFEALRPGSELNALADAAWCRSVGDWLVGLNATRALTQRLKSRGETGAWSAGRVQTPTLHLLVERERAILAHTPRAYVEVVATFEHNGASWQGKYHDPSRTSSEDRDQKPARIFDEAFANRVLAAVQQAATGDASEKRKRSKQRPPLPFDLTSLQREANKRFGFSAKRTLDAAQRLYEGHKATTYPRTDSRYLPSDYEPTIAELLGTLSADVEYKGVAGKILAEGPKNLEKVLDSSKITDHFAIVPTGVIPEGLRSGDARIYDLIVRQFLASLMGPATWALVERTVVLDNSPALLAQETARFRTTSRSLEIPGFFEALRRASDDANEDPAAAKLPALVPGKDTVDGVPVQVLSGESERKQTKPPARYNEAQLLRLMETAGQLVDDEELSEALSERGLGTPATRADTIEGLVYKTYLRRTSGRLAPTSKAMRLMDILSRVEVEALCSAALTGEWEHGLRQIQDGELSRDELLSRLIAFTTEITEHLVGFDHETLYANEPPLGPCPACKEGKVVESAWGYPCSRNTGRDAPCKFIIWKDRAGKYLDRRVAKTLVAEGRIGPVGGFFNRSGLESEATMVLEHDEDADKWVVRLEYGDSPAEQDTPEVMGDPLCPCPVHEGCHILESDRRYVCEQLYTKQVKTGPVLPKVVCFREMTPEEAGIYFSEAGKTDVLDAFISKRGRPFRGALFRKPTGKHGFEFPPREPRGKKAASKKAAPKKAASSKAKKAAPKKAASSKAKKAAPKKAAPKKAASSKAKKATPKKAAVKKGSKAVQSGHPSPSEDPKPHE